MFNLKLIPLSEVTQSQILDDLIDFLGTGPIKYFDQIYDFLYQKYYLSVWEVVVLILNLSNQNIINGFYSLEYPDKRIKQKFLDILSIPHIIQCPNTQDKIIVHPEDVKVYYQLNLNYKIILWIHRLYYNCWGKLMQISYKILR